MPNGLVYIGFATLASVVQGERQSRACSRFAEPQPTLASHLVCDAKLQIFPELCKKLSDYFCLRSKIFNYSFIDVVDKWSAFNNAHARHGIVLTSSIFLPHGIVETSFTLLSLTRNIHLFIYSNTTGRFSVSHEQSQVLLELCHGEEKLERSSRFWIVQNLYYRIIIYYNI